VAPDQAPALNEGFTPSAQEVRDAEQRIQAFDQARGAGKPWGECNGVLVDRASADGARGLVEWAEACATRDRFKADAVDRARNELRKTSL
jgi:citrate lyase beta subunit